VPWTHNPITSTAAVGYLIIAAWLLFPAAHWIEWIAVADLLLFVGLLGARTTRPCRTSRQTTHAQ
jgi:hypothetical protein